MGRLIRSTLVAVAVALVASFAFTSVAGAQDNDAYIGNKVTTTVPGEVQSESVVIPKAGEKPAVQANKLAFTGSDAASLALIGLVAVVAGGSILLIRRRSTVN